MIGKEQLFYDNDRLCIEIARGEGVLKGFDVPQTKRNAFLYHKAQLVELPWQGVQMIGERCCLVFYPHELLKEIPTSSSELPKSLRPRAFELLRELTHALGMAGENLFWLMDSIPLSNFWFFDNGDILLLSSQMGDILDRFELSEDRFRDKSIWHAHNCIDGYGKAQFLFQLLYYTLSGVAPFESPEVRENGFRAVPLELLFPPSSTATEIFRTIDKAISDDRKFQYTVSNPMSFFIQTLDKLSEVPDSSLVPGENPNMEFFRAKLEKRAGRRVFLRRKGLKVTLISIAAAVVLGIAIFYVYRAVKPPVTKDLNEVQLIEWYYDAVTNLDVSAMDEALRNGYSGPDMMEVSSLYVTSAYQKAYGGASNVVNPNDWIAGGMQALPQYSTVYGATDIRIEQLSDDVYRAYVTFWTTASNEDYIDTEDLDKQTDTTVYEYLHVVDITFRSRGYWREITKIETVEDTLIKEHHVPFSE